MINFREKLGAASVAIKPTDPITIYQQLDRASDKGPLRPSQLAVLTNWHSNFRSEKDVIVKMHTGQGKTLTGLLILKSKLNEGIGPAVYLCPNNQLVDQTVKQAKQFGIEACVADGELPSDFIDGEKILITSVQKLFNGLTRFRLGAQSQPVGAIVLDDCHSCIDSIRDSCTITIPKSHPAYSPIVDLFELELRSQGAGTFEEIKNDSYNSFLPVPYWGWFDHYDAVLSILAKHASTDALRFQWPLLKDHLKHCSCVVSGERLEIASNTPPLGLFGSYSRALHRVFMSATVTNDAFLVKGLGVKQKAIENPLIDKETRWSGEKLILIPSLVNSLLKREDIISVFGQSDAKRKFGVVVLAPSFRIAKSWPDANLADSKTATTYAEHLRDGLFEKTIVFANRYDGIDLPDQACRILILDSKPAGESLIDKWTESCRIGSTAQLTKIARTIEQGLGRSVRGEKDYSVILIIGSDIVSLVRARSTAKFFSSQTQLQIQIGVEAASFAREEVQDKGKQSIDAIHELIQSCLKRDEGWKEFYRQRMDKIELSDAPNLSLQMFTLELAAEDAFQKDDPDLAVKSIQDLLDKYTPNESDKGWYLQEMGRLSYFKDKEQSNKFQISAHKKNQLLLKPKHGMQVEPLSAIGYRRISCLIEWLKQFSSASEMLLEIDSILSDLRFGVDADKFELALDKIGTALGFLTQRPDKQLKEGPDNLWMLKDGEYLLMECKSEVLQGRTAVNKGETGQMNNSIAWFRKAYPGANSTNLLIIPTRSLQKGAGFVDNVSIMNSPKLQAFVKNIETFYRSFKHSDLQDLSDHRIQTQMIACHLVVDDILELYSQAPNQAPS